MMLKFLKLNTKKAISILCAIFILAAALPLNALLLPTDAVEAGNLIDFEGENAESIVNGNDAFSLAGQDKEDKYYLYAKNNTANTLTLNFDSIALKTDKKYTLDFDVYTLRMSKDEGNALLGLKLYGKDKTSLNATISNMDVCEEEWANYHTTFVAKEKNNKLDFSLFTFGKVFIDNLVLIDENGKETALDFAKACEKTEHPDHFSSSTLYDIAYDEVDVVDGYLKAVVPENSNTIHNEGVDIPFNIGKNIEAGRYTVKLDVKFTAVGSCRNSFCVSVAGMDAEIQQKWIDAVDVTLNKYETFSYEFDLLPEHNYFRFNVYQGCTAYIDNVYLIDAAGVEVVKFDFDSPVNFRGAFYEQKGIPRNRAASAALYSRLMRSSNVSDYAIYFESGAQNNFWVTKKDASHPELGMEELNLSADKTYTVDFDVYALTAGSNVVFGGTTATWDTTAAINGNDGTHQLWKSAPTTLNTWTHYSFNVTTVAEWKGLIFYVVGSGFKGYIDNLTIKDGNNVVASFNPTDTTLTSNCASIVDLPVSVANAKPEEKSGDHAIYFDSSINDNFWVTKKSAEVLNLGMEELNLPAGNTYTVDFDVYSLTLGHRVVFGATTEVWTTNPAIEGGHQVWKEAPTSVNTWTHYSFNVTTIAEWNGVMFYVIDDADGFTGYIDNLTIKEGNNVVASFNPTDTTLTSNCASIVDLPVSVADAKDAEDDEPSEPEVGSDDFAIEVDNSKGTNFGQFYLHELGMSYDTVYPVGDYTIKFDFYLLEMASNKDIVACLSAPDWSVAFPGNEGQVWLNIANKVGEWQTLSFDVRTIKDGQFPNFHLGAGIKGYFDNYQIIDNKTGNTLLDFSPVEGDLGKTSHSISKVVELPVDVAEAKNNIGNEDPTSSGMKITVLRGRAGKDGASIKLGGANSPLTLKSNSYYRLSFRYYQANPTNSGVLNLFGINTGFDNDIAYFKKNNTEGWANGTVYFTTGEVTDTTADWLEIILNPNAWVYFDNFKLVEQEPDNNKEVSIIKFDKPDDTIYPTLTAEKATFAHSSEHGGTFKVVNATEYTNTDKNSNRTYTFKGIKMKPNTTYRVSIDYYVAVPFTDYAAAFGYDQSALGIGTGASWPCYIDNVTVKGWHTKSFTVTTGDVVPNGSYINLAFYDVANSKEPRVMHFDNLSFTELYKVETSVNDTTLGTVTKTKTLEAGESVRISANAFAGAKFEGWYEYGDLVSKDKNYSIKNIDDNHKLQAVFSGKAKPAKTIVQSFEDYDLGDIDFPWYEIVNDSKNVLHGNQSLHIKPDKITESIEASIFFPVVSNVKYQLKDDYSYDFYVWVKPAKTPKSVAYYAIVNSMSRDLSDMVYSGELSGTSMSLNIKPQAADAVEEKDGWFKYRIGTITKKNASMEGYAFQICKFHANRGEGASIDDLYIDRVEVVERTPDFANLKFTEKFFNEISNSNFEEKVTEENWAPLTDGVTIEKVTDKEFDWQGNYNLKFDAAKSNGQEYVRVIPISKLSKNYTFAAWTKLSKGSDITVGLYKNGRYEKFENIVNGQNGTLPMIDDGKWNRVSFTFNSGDSSEAYLVIKGTKGTLYLDMVEMFIAERGYLKDPNRYGKNKTGFDLFDPIAFPDEVITNVTYVDVVEEELQEQEEPTEETEDKKPSKKKYKVIKKRKPKDTMTRVWVGIGSGVLLAGGAGTSFIFFKKRKNILKGVK